MKHHHGIKVLLLIGLFLSKNIHATATIIEKSPLDNRQYYYSVLANDLKVIVVSDPNAKTTGVTLVVNAGSFDEPKEFPGLAHLLEHMLFLGTKKFPATDEFKKYLQANAGAFNATTLGEQTKYYFNVHPDALPQALERFSDFFIAPLLQPSLIEREINAVDAEFHVHLHQDNWGTIEVNKETSNPSHPISRFTIGNLKTLKASPLLHQSVIDFYKKNYSSDRMTVALVGPQPVHKLMALAKQHFEGILKVPTTPRSASSLPYAKEQLGVDIHVKSQSEKQELHIIFPFQRKLSHTDQKATSILARLLGNESHGGIPHYLKKLNWINGMSVNFEQLTFDQDALSLHVSLTPLGLKNIDNITKTLFSYIKLLNKEGVPPYFFQEIKEMCQWRFQYTEKESPESFSDELASDLQEYSPKELLTHSFIMPQFGYPQKEFNEILSQLKPENMRRLIISQDEQGDQKSKWYGVTYKTKKIPFKKLKEFSDVSMGSELSLPDQNPYIPKKLSLAKMTGNARRSPQEIKMPGIKLWHHQDVQFNIPKGDILLNVASPIHASPENAILSGMFVSLVLEDLREDLYPAALAGGSYHIYNHPRGITIVVNGYSENQEKILTKILERLHSFQIDDVKFSLMKDRFKQNFKSYHQLALYEKAMSDLNVLLSYPAWHPDEMLAAVETVTKDKLTHFKNDFLRSIEVEMLVNGNYTKEDAKKIAKIAALKYSQPKAESPKSIYKVIKLPQRSTSLRTIDSTSNNHIALWYLQNPIQDYPTMAKTILLSKFLEVSFYQKLRVEQQLGYALNADAMVLNKVSGLIFWIQSAKAPSNELLNCMKNFLQSSHQQLALLSEKDVKEYQNALIHQLEQPPQSLEEMTAKWWDPIERGDYEFDRREKLIAAVRKVKLQDLVSLSKQLFDGEAQVGQLLMLSKPNTSVSKERLITSMQVFKGNAEYFPS